MIDFIKDISLQAGQMTLASTPSIIDANISFKTEKDLVTEVDKKVEDFLVKKIKHHFPDHSILGEETGKTEGTSDYCWIIDPIDGTTSFVHDQPFYSISIALQKNNELIAGVVNAPKLNELFWAEKGNGSYLNDTRIQVSQRNKLISSVLATGFACLRANWQNNNLPIFNKIAPNIRGIRRYGSAAIDLSYVACGRLEGFWEMNLKPYDIAAGVLLVKEAGGTIMDFNGEDHYLENGIIATNGLIDTELLAYFK